MTVQPVHPTPPAARPFGTVLVANRGEIACRVIGTLRRLGIRSVAVFSDADAGARHVREADVAVRLGPAPAARSYLDVEAVVAAAVATGAEAIHPGYGFLSENPALATACARAGIAFVGPGVEALDAMADKLAAKRIVAARGVPVVPGAGEPGMPDDAVLAAAPDVGFPLLVKPSAGGGGKGMVVVRSADDLPAALASARRVAASSFGDDTLLLERLVEAPRHIELQVLADTHGTVIHLGERECSLQRRHQKVVEEAPSPLLSDSERARMGEAACEVARSVGYVGAGTVEFLVPAASPDEFFFIEMNTRLQVEHPVTELVTGLDLVELQLRVAAGEPLPLAQDDVELRGHAVEARIYAESPARGFLPATGTVLAYDDAGAPSGPMSDVGTAPLRLDSGIDRGTVVGGDYDPMLAKAVAWAPTRAEAILRLDGLLAETVVLGVETNVGFLRSLLADEDVRAGRLDTGLIGRLLGAASGVGSGEGVGGVRAVYHPRARSSPAPARPDHDGAHTPDPLASSGVSAVDRVAAALFVAEHASVPREHGVGHRIGADPVGNHVLGGGGEVDPWRAGDGWRLNAPAAARVVVLRDVTGLSGGPDHEVRVTGTARDAVVHLVAADGGAPDGDATVRAAEEPGEARASLVPDTLHDDAWWLSVDGTRERVRLAWQPAADGEPAVVWLHRDGRTVAFAAPDRAERSARSRDERRRARGGTAAATDPEVRAAMPGTVVATVTDGDAVTAGAVLVTVEAMKMEHPVLAPHDGVAHVTVRPGDLVRRDQVVAVVEPAPPPAAGGPAASDPGAPAISTTATPPDAVAAHPAAPATSSDTQGAP
ncbi:biotin carboxylase N-terminal domain-containing protein [Cellulosimicrobium sp. PMB13]|uniref:acetyl/propionyl/methylcrotonyl-CoA carboxylase subunit alpha n=1 Tax=Cellulosimicrobium sp. PMB13 TaxID=3120158 RepID=UPI003F4C724D